MRPALRAVLVAGGLVTCLCTSSAVAWGDKGHQISALIAYRHLSDRARTALDAMLAGDGDALTAQDFASRASWADRYRNSHRETAAWHYVNLEIGQPELEAACFHFPPLSGQPASLGPPEDCVVNKIEQFAAELNEPRTAAAERLLALKFLIHFVADLHQPLHAADHDDHGGNCVGLTVPGAGRATNLHAFWDVSTVEALGASASAIAASLDADITPALIKQWSGGTVRDWAFESFALGKQDAYALPVLPTCASGGPVMLSPDYEESARRDAALQLKRAAIRMAALLNQALGL